MLIVSKRFSAISNRFISFLTFGIAMTGGIVGYNVHYLHNNYHYNTIQNCEVSGTICRVAGKVTGGDDGESLFTGGISGFSGGRINNCINDATITGGRNVVFIQVREELQVITQVE